MELVLSNMVFQVGISNLETERIRFLDRFGIETQVVASSHPTSVVAICPFLKVKRGVIPTHTNVIKQGCIAMLNISGAPPYMLSRWVVCIKMCVDAGQ